jgi:uncharacterized protein YxeA
MRKTLQIISTIIIGVSSICFLVIPQHYDDKINELKNKNDEIKSQLESTLEFVFKANSAQELAFLLTDNFDIFQNISHDLKKLTKKQHRIGNTIQDGALYAIDAYNCTGKITSDVFKSEINRLRKFKRIEQCYDFYGKYMKLAGEGTFELSTITEKNKKQINDLIILKNKLSDFLFSFQCLGLLLGIIAIGLESKK